ncbi:MFS transporter [Bradyrhizobium sp. BRP22]|uniref:MFS transporter n=1 Tax=Bradyrhizobium sp. BRP22 TaxID=2793821 RepID=UPI001CD67687|nr:MFS transporter [Bradyrhizobium sp. BRP22]MCA1452638.1 MFS transporter [Bradyrhizobium sp. BRP22]
MQPAALTYTTKERNSVLISTLFGYGLDFYNILIISFLMGAIQKSLNITLTEAGIITTVTLVGSVVGGVLFGWLGDRIGRKNSLLYTLGLFSVGAILSAFAWDFNSLLFFRAIAGIGLGGEWGAGIVLFNEVWDKNRRGFGSSVIQAASTAGIAAASVVAVWSLSTFSPEWGWRIALLTGGSPILLMVYVRFWMPESKLWAEYERMRKAGELPPEKSKAGNPLIEIFKGASLRYTILGFVIVSGYMFAFYSITVFMPGFMRNLGAPPETIRAVTLLFALALAVAFLVFGWFTDSLGRKIGVVLPTIVSIVGFIGIYMSADSTFNGSLLAWPLFAWYVFWGVGQTAAGMFGPWFSELYPVELRSSAVSTIYMIGRGVGSIAPFVVPFVAANTTSGIIGGMMAGLLAAVLCALAALLLPETAGRSFSVIESKVRSAA